ncbi:MAG: YceI family protein [Chitinophagaceae bacterium]|nr:YceI family protein [Chitinophagaceae bacterium]
MLKHRIIVICLFFLVTSLAKAQGKFYTKSGKITFFSSASLEDIEAINKSVVVLLDTKSGELQFAVLMKGFEFKKALMQEHFNRDYVESDKFPKAEFKGQVINNQEINYSADGNYTANVKGKLTIHGQSKDIETSGTITARDGKLILHSIFNVLVADYKITIPRLYRDNISKSIKVTVDCSLVVL